MAVDLKRKWGPAGAVACNDQVEIAVPVRIGGNRRHAAGSRWNGLHHHVLAKLFETKKQEGLVAPVVNFGDPQRTADRHAIIMPLGGRPQTGIRLIGIEDFVRGEVVDAAMQLIGAGLHGRVDDRTRRAVFRRVVAGLHGHFLNCIHAGLSHRGVAREESLAAGCLTLNANLQRFSSEN